MIQQIEELMSWSERFGLIEHYKPCDDLICQVFDVSPEELAIARDLLHKGTFKIDKSNVKYDKYAEIFKQTPLKVFVPTGIQMKIATKRKGKKKVRGRPGDKIAKAFASLSSTPVTVQSIIDVYEVSLAVLRQSKRFDPYKQTGSVKVYKDKSTGEMMIVRVSGMEQNYV